MKGRRASTLDLFPDLAGAPDPAGASPMPAAAPVPAAASPGQEALDLSGSALDEPPGIAELELPLREMALPRPQRPAGFAPRAFAALLDLLALGLALAIVALIVELGWGLGRSALTDPFFHAFAMLFGFVATLFALAFWGRTPGLALLHLRARNADGSPLTFVQAARRFAGGMACVATAGLAWLVLAAGDGGSPADRLSSSSVYPD